jgi:hypothetical protein
LIALLWPGPFKFIANQGEATVRTVHNLSPLTPTRLMMTVVHQLNVKLTLHVNTLAVYNETGRSVKCLGNYGNS